jgi:hypothetical protein
MNSSDRVGRRATPPDMSRLNGVSQQHPSSSMLPSFSPGIMKFRDECPQCGSRAISPGHIKATPNVPWFEPDGLRWWTLKPTGQAFLRTEDAGLFNAPARACTQCGLVWAYLDPDRLKQTLLQAGTDATRERFSQPPDQPARPPR